MGYRFVMANALVIIFAAILLGPLSMANTLDDETVIGPADEMDETPDFDTNRLVFSVTDDFDVETGTMNALVWNQEVGPDGEEYGFVTYNVSGMDSFLIQAQTGRWSFSSEMEAEIRPEGLVAGSVVENPTVNIFDGRNDLGQFFTEDTEEVEIRVGGDQDSHALVDIVEPGVDLNDFVDRDRLLERDFTVEQSMFDSVRSTLYTSASALVQLPSVVVAWVDFSFAVPGLVGTAFRMYVGAFVAYLLVTEVWIG